jgi:MoaA/NifB/PqqE/SkfB family radical SAM enzyme
MAMGMTLMQQTYERLQDNYDVITADTARVIHGIYLDALRGARDCGKEISLVVMNGHVAAEAQDDFRQYVELVRRVISNQ